MEILLWSLLAVSVFVFMRYMAYPYLRIKYSLWRVERMTRLLAKHNPKRQELLNEIADLAKAARKSVKMGDY